jgi:superfamily II DNA or RNA helicase
MEESLAQSSSVTTEPRSLQEFLAKLSDRGIQRIVGANAYLRGRIYARRSAVSDLQISGGGLDAQVAVRSDEFCQVHVEYQPGQPLTSHCNCSSWRGPKSHCKHVAAVLVSARDRERPNRPAPESANGGSALEIQELRTNAYGETRHTPSSPPAPQNGAHASGAASPSNSTSPSVAPSATGKRRRSRRRRRTPGSGEGAGSSLELMTGKELGIHTASEARGVMEAWLPSDEAPRAPDLEFRLTIRAASMTVTPVLAGTRSAVAVNDILTGFSYVPPQVRSLLRSLQRHTARNQPATAEVRGEDAAEILSMLQGRRVLLDPASMELRFAEEPLKPKLELDSAGAGSVRVRVVFETKSGHRRFSLSSGAWFEGSPSWYIDATEGVARPVVEGVTPLWLQRLYRSPSLLLPIQELPRMLTDFVPRVASSLGAELPDLSAVADVVDAAPHFQLRAKGDLIEARVRLRVVYEGVEQEVPVRGIPSPLAFQPPKEHSRRPRVVRRDVGAEMAAVQELFNLGFVVDESSDDLIARGEQAIAFWTDGIGKLPETWDRFIPNDLVDVTIRQTPVSAHMRVSSGVDWLSLDMSFDAEGIAVSEDELRMCLAQGRKLVQLQDGSYAPVQADQVTEILSRMAEIYVTSGSKGKLPLSQAGRVQDLMRIVSESNATTSTEALFGKLNDIGRIEPVAKPRALKATLRPYQKEGFSWLVFLHSLNAGGILADDMGLGKTLQTIALLLWVKSKEKESKTLVVAPTSVVPNWVREIEKFAPTLKTITWQGPDRHALASEAQQADVIVTSYALLRRDEEFLQSLNLTYSILDEAQHIKNPLSATSRAAKKLQSQRRLALTGTPIENRLSEIWSIFDFVSPGLLGTLASFEEQYARPIERGDEDTVRRLRSAIHPFVMRRTKSEVAKDLPEKIEQDMVVPLAEEQSKLYRQILRQVREQVLSEIDLQGVAKSQIQILAALTRLRQVACDPKLLKLDGDWNAEESGKVGALREILSEAVSGGHRVLVFSQFVEMLKILQENLQRDGITYEYLDGSTKDRQERVDHFNQDESVSVFLISLKAGGTGLNLTGADTVIHFDPWWNPAVEDQATDRAHRIGQTKVVTVYRLIAKSTVEEKILQLSDKKRELVSQVLSTEGAPLKGLTRDEIDSLFSE